MTSTRWLVLLLCVMPCMAACGDTPKAKAAELRQIEAARKEEVARRLAAAAATPDKMVPVGMWIMPPQLREISGLALTSRGTVLTHDDNSGRVSEIDPTTGILKKSFSLVGNQKEDFEAITIAGVDIYLMASDGKLFRFREGDDGQQVSFMMFDTGLGKLCEFESLAYEADSTRLLMACKRGVGNDAPKDLIIYRMPLPLNRATFRQTLTTLQVPLNDVVGTNQWKSFRPSDMTIDPFTKNLVIIASHEHGLAVLTPDGDVVRSGPLPGDHKQPEGVAITKDSILVISDEANVNPAAITLYKWRP
jgi:uncharacterized protein YjiK